MTVSFKKPSWLVSRARTTRQPPSPCCLTAHVSLGRRKHTVWPRTGPRVGQTQPQQDCHPSLAPGPSVYPATLQGLPSGSGLRRRTCSDGWHVNRHAGTGLEQARARGLAPTLHLLSLQRTRRASQLANEHLGRTAAWPARPVWPAWPAAVSHRPPAPSA